jgi:hypothetical protein
MNGAGEEVPTALSGKNIASANASSLHDAAVAVLNAIPAEQVFQTKSSPASPMESPATSNGRSDRESNASVRVATVLSQAAAARLESQPTPLLADIAFKRLGGKKTAGSLDAHAAANGQGHQLAWKDLAAQAFLGLGG